MLFIYLLWWEAIGKWPYGRTLIVLICVAVLLSVTGKRKMRWMFQPWHTSIRPQICKQNIPVVVVIGTANASSPALRVWQSPVALDLFSGFVSVGCPLYELKRYYLFLITAVHTTCSLANVLLGSSHKTKRYTRATLHVKPLWMWSHQSILVFTSILWVGSLWVSVRSFGR